MTTTTQSSTEDASSNRPPASITPQVPQTITSPESSPTSPQPSSNKRDFAIGVGVGLPVAVAALSILGFLLLRERRRQRHAEKTASDDAKAKHRNGEGIAKAEFIDGIPRELSSTAIGPNELHCQQIYEAGSGNGRHDSLSPS